MSKVKRHIFNDRSHAPIMEAIDAVEYMLKCHIERERLAVDREWLKVYLMARPGIRWIRVMKTKTEGFTFIHRGYHFDAYIVKRKDPKIATLVWMLYLVVPDYS